jgi:hypothetical protein
VGSDPRSVEARLDELCRRIEALEARADAAPSPASEPAAPRPRSEDDGEGPERPWLAASVSLVGRTLMVLGGAFLLRHLTESHVLPQALGTALGVAYAILWLVVADLTRRMGGASSTFFGISSTLIAFPLFWETTLKFHTLSPLLSALCVTLYAAAGLGASVVGRMHGAGVVTAAPAAVTLATLGFATGRPLPFLLCLGLLALVCLASAYRLRWTLLGASVAVVADLTVLLLTVVYAIRHDSPRLGGVTPAYVATAQFGLLAIYFGGAALRITGRRRLGGIDLLQVAGAFAIALGGVLLTHHGGRLPPLPWGLFAVLAGALAFALAYGPLCEPGAPRAALATLSASSLAAIGVGLLLALPAPALAPVLAVAAVALIWLASARPRRGLTTHAAAYLLGAAVASGMAERIGRAFVSGRVGFDECWSAGMIGTMAAAAASCAFTVPLRSVPDRPRRTPIVPLALVSLVVGAVAISLFAGVATSAVRSSIVRTVVLSAATLAVALAVRVQRLRGARRLLVPLLVAGGLKLVVQDLPAGRPAVLFGTLGVYGATLIVAPRLQRASLRRSAPVPAPGPT